MRTAVYIYETARAARQWYSTTRQMLRDRPGCFNYNVNLASGKDVMTAISALVEPLSDAVTLQKAGLLVENLTANKALAGLSKESPLVLEQDSLSAELFQVSTGMAFHWLAACCIRMFAYPSAFLGLIAADAQAGHGPT